MIKRVKTKGKGNVLTQQQIDVDLVGLVEEIKAYMIAQIESTGKHKLLKKGGLAEEIKVELVKDGVKYELPEYAQYIDSGRLPFTKRIPLDALEKWIKRYRIGLRNKKTGRFQKGETSATELAWAIREGIFKNGIKPRPFIENTIKFTDNLIEEYINTVVVPDIITTIEFIVSEK